MKMRKTDVHRQARGIGSVSPRPVLVAIGTMCAPVHTAHADILADAYYDRQRDQLQVTMLYRGSNSRHHFSLKWGPCHQRPDGKASSVSVQVLDDQWQDIEQRDYTKTTRFSLATLACRPAYLTLHTPPHFYYEVFIPAVH
jgi:hypothetical protein